MADDDVEVPAPVIDGWVIDSEDKADWAARKVLEAEEHVARLEAQHAIRIARARAEASRTLQAFGPQLQAWAARHMPRDRRSVDIPSARLAFRRVPGGIRITDRAACLAWAREHLPSAILRSFTEQLDLQAAQHEAERRFSAELADAFARAAESSTEADAVAAIEGATAAAEAALPPGVRNVPDEDRFTVLSPTRRAR